MYIYSLKLIVSDLISIWNNYGRFRRTRSASEISSRVKGDSYVCDTYAIYLFFHTDPASNDLRAIRVRYSSDVSNIFHIFIQRTPFICFHHRFEKEIVARIMDTSFQASIDRLSIRKLLFDDE